MHSLSASAVSDAPDLSGDLRAADLTGADLRRKDLSGRDLTGANLTGSDLRGSNLVNAILRDAVIRDCRLDDVELTGADLRGADLSESSGERACFGRADLRGASLFRCELSQARLIDADLRASDLRTARLSRARLRGADMTGADLTGADLRGADLTECILSQSCFDDVDLRRARVKRVRGYRNASWIGTTILDVDFTGAYALRRHIMDQNYLDEMRRSSPYHNALYLLWWVTSDCGRSLARWSLCTLIIAMVFGLMFSAVAVSYGQHQTALSPYYFSIVTLTTLGYGDALPASSAAQIMVMAEVVIGYTMLGGLVSIVSTKMARRAE